MQKQLSLKRNIIKESGKDRIFTIVVYMILITSLVVVAYPLYFMFIASFSDPVKVGLGKIWLFPDKITWDGYARILKDNDIWVGYANTIFYTVAGTLLNLILTLTSAYALSRPDLKGSKTVMFILVFTMFFNGGLIPTYLLVRSLGMLDTYWAMIIPGAVSVFNIIITRTFFQTTIPDELLEAAKIDGCSNTRFFISIVLPLSGAIIAVMIIFYSVGHWNEYFNALIYLNDKNKFPLQMFLREILIQQQYNSQMQIADDNVMKQQAMAESMKYGVIIVSSLPVLVLYPFLQKYFIKGVLIGAIKG